MKTRAIMEMAHKVRIAAAERWGGRPGEYSMGIALEMAWEASSNVKEKAMEISTEYFGKITFEYESEKASVEAMFENPARFWFAVAYCHTERMGSHWLAFSAQHGGKEVEIGYAP